MILMIPISWWFREQVLLIRRKLWICNDNDYADTIFNMKQQAIGFEAIDKSQEFKQQNQELCQASPRQQCRSPKSVKNHSSSPAPGTSNNAVLVLISVCFFTVVVLAVNEHYSRQMLAVMGSAKDSEQLGGNAEAIDEQLLARVNEMTEKEAKLFTRLGEMGKLLERISRQPLNILDSHQSPQQTAGREQLRREVAAMDKELTAIRYDMSTFATATKKDNNFIANQLTTIKDLILQGPKGAGEQQADDERSFEADFATATPEAEEKFTAQSESYVADSYTMEIPKKLWLYEAVRSTYMNELIHNNNLYYGKKSKYEVIMLNRTNYKAYLSLKGAETLQKLISLLEKRQLSQSNSNIRWHFQKIVKKLILLAVLKEKGGVITDGEFALAEDFSWIKGIVGNQYVNRGSRGIKPEVVGFYSPDYSFDQAKENIKPFEGMHPVDKYMIAFPALEDYFIAAVPESRFMKALLLEIAQLLSSASGFKGRRGQYRLNNLKGEDIYYEYFMIAVQVVLQDKQKQIDAANIDQYRHFAIDYYGLHLINCYYAPYKLKAFWGNAQPIKIYQSLTQYTLQQLQANIGPLRYIVRFTPAAKINGYLEETKSGRRKSILEGSFMQRILYPEAKASFISKNQEQPFVKKQAVPWVGLPKIIWVFWDKGLANAPVNNQICVQSLRRMGKLSGFEVKEVNLSNVHSYLEKKTLDRINYSVEHAKLKVYAQSRADLIRLALIANHGGIYMDASFIALESLEWLLNIASYPSQFIFNRFGETPKVFMMWHPHYGSPLEWSIDQRHHTKAQWHLAYENNFIAAEKGSELVEEWFQLLLDLYIKPFSEVEKVFQDCLMSSHKWSTANWHYLIPMDAVKCVIGRRQAQLRKTANKEYVSASDFYRVWSMSGYLGQQKLRSNTNFDDHFSEDNKLVYRYSQAYAEGLVGKIRHLVKFYSQHNKELSRLVSRHINGDFSQEAHPDSIFMRHMWHSNFKLAEGTFYPKLITPRQ